MEITKRTNKMTIINFKTFINEAKRLSGNLVMKDRKTMRKKLRENILVFKFQKRDGTIRRAVGTLYPDLLPPIKGTGGPKPVYQMVYFDLEKLAWRSFRSFKFIKILKETPITDSIVDEYLKKIEEEKRRKEEEKKHKITKREKEKREKERELEREEEEKERERKHKEHEEHKKKIEKKHEEHKDEHEEKHDDDKSDGKKTFKVGDKIPEKELMRRSVDMRKGSRKNDTTRKANDKFKKGELKD
jgi:flagellar biosynthesis GTPase FlhF